MIRSQRLVWGIAIGLQFCCAGRLLGQAVDVFVNPASQTGNVGDPVSVEIRLNANALSVCQGGVFLQFDSVRLNFVNGVNNTATWNLGSFDVEPAQNQPGVVSLNVGAASPVSANDVLVSTLNFTATSGGAAGLSLLFNAGREETQFFASNCATTVTTNRTGGSVSIEVPTPTPSPTFTPTKTTPTPIAGQCVGDCDGSGDVTVDEIIMLANIDRGTADASACPNGIPSGEAVDITLIIQAVNNALNGCP